MRHQSRLKIKKTQKSDEMQNFQNSLIFEIFQKKITFSKFQNYNRKRNLKEKTFL